MRKKIASLCLLWAWLCANGAVLDAVQVFAWGRMFTGYAQSMPLAAALRETLDPTKPCELCGVVSNAKADWGQQELPASNEQSSGKLVLALDVPAQFVLTATPGDWPPALASAAPRRTERVPVPPPRA